MKKQMIAALLLSSAVISVPAFADFANPALHTDAQPATHNVQAKTRAQVYQALVDAENSGALARMNLLYFGG